MFLQFFTSLRDAQVPVTLREYLTLMEALNADLTEQTVENFYYLSRTALVKDERNLDKFDQVFGHVFKGLEGLDGSLLAQIPEEWLKALTEKFLSEEEKKMIEAAGGWDKLMQQLKERMEEQKKRHEKRHEKGNKAIGTGGTSPISVYSRTYETAALETLHYRIQFASGTVGGWAVEATIEFATPRDDDKQRDFLNAVFTEALVHIAKVVPPTGPVIPAESAAPPPAPAPLAGPTNPR